MSTPFNSASWGIQQLIDATLTVAETGLPVYYRIQNTAPNISSDAEQLGFELPATGAAAGTTDIQIFPQPRVKNVSMNAILMSGGQLNAASRIFTVSDTFVQQILATYGTTYNLTDGEQIWDGFPLFIGLMCDKTLYDVVQYAHSEVSGTTVSWRLVCKAIINKSQ